MKLLVLLHAGVPTGQKPSGIPDDWPAEVREVGDGEPVPSGWLQMADAAELSAYRASKQSGYDAWRSQVELPAARDAKFAAIDGRTSELIAQGFSYGGKVFSLSANAQQTYTGLYAVRNEVLVSYPVKVNTLDNLDNLLLTDAGAVTGFYLTAVGTYRARLDSGTALKDLVRVAVDLAAVAAVADTR